MVVLTAKITSFGTSVAVPCLVALCLSACGTGHRPIRQLNTGQFMAGASLNLVNQRADAMGTMWLRFAPWTYIDFAVGGIVSIPIFDGFAGGVVGEARVHVPLTNSWRLVFVASDDYVSREFNDQRISSSRPSGRGWTHQISGTVFAAYKSKQGEIYFGPRLTYLTHLSRQTEHSDLVSIDVLRYFQGGGPARQVTFVAGLEQEFGGWTVGGGVELGALSAKGGRGSTADPAISLSIYVAY